MALPISCTCLQQLQRTSNILRLFRKTASTRAPQAVFIEKTLEEPIIVVRDEVGVDLIGPPDRVSNLRPIIRKLLQNETVLQRQFRETADATQSWNQEFWAIHNTNFIKEKEAYIKQNTSDKKPQLNADEMSAFYKDFLNKYWKNHVNYNFKWYRKNFNLLFLALRVNIEKFQHRLL